MHRYLVCALLLVLLVSGAFAQSYSFTVPQMMLSVYVNPDASALMKYEITFGCEPGAHPIDIVDIGLPHSDYNISNMSAELNGVPVGPISKSTMVDIGVEIPLGSKTINPGQSGTLTFRATMPKMVYQDTTRSDYASFQITPTWFGSEYIQGTTKLGVAVYLSPDIKNEEILHQGQDFTSVVKLQDYIVASWLFTGTRLDGPHKIGMSFPKRNMSNVMRMSKFMLFMKWWKEAEDVRLIIGIIMAIIFAIFYFRVTGMTGCSCFTIFLAGFSFLFVIIPGAQLLAIPPLILLAFSAHKALRRKKGKYMPAIVSTPGGGIKRGLTAAEAALLLELPLGKVVTMVIFGLLQKKVVEQIDAKPMRLKLLDNFDLDTKGERRKIAGLEGITLHAYEQFFIDVIRLSPGEPVNKMDFRDAIKEFINHVIERVKGFDVARTREYYAKIVEGAWAQAKAIGEVESRDGFVDENLLWLMLGEGGDDTFDELDRRTGRYDPPWMRRTIFINTGGGGGMPVAPAGDTFSPGGQTSFGEVAASFAGWSENVAGSFAGKLDGLVVSDGAKGLINLAGADKLTLNMLSEMSKGGGSGGGGGCAGCACACACAGGGR